MTILCYHDVHAGWDAPLAVTPAALAEQMEWLARHRATVDLGRALGHLDRRGRLPQGMAAITFDDGFRGVLQHGAPPVARWGLPATVFVVAEQLLEDAPAVDWLDRPPAWPAETLTVDELVELRDRGFRIESHSAAHRDLTRLADRELDDDLRRSREIIADLLGQRVDLLAYPRGRHDARVRRAAEAAGFRMAFSLPERREPVGPYAVPRVGIYRGDTLRTVRLKCTRAFLPARTHPGYTVLRDVVTRPRRSRGAAAAA